MYVARILSNDDGALLVRNDGEGYLVELGVGCLSIWRYEGRKVLVVSPGLFLGIGSELLLPEDAQKCRIWNSSYVGPISVNSGRQSTVITESWSSGPPIAEVLRAAQRQQKEKLRLFLAMQEVASHLSPEETAEILAALNSGDLKLADRLISGATLGSSGVDPAATIAAQAALELLGYDPGPLDGKFGSRTSMAVARFQEDFGLPQSGQLDVGTRQRLVSELISRSQGAQGARSISQAITEPTLAAAPMAGCGGDHWIASVLGGGELIRLEDGTIWQVDALDRIESMLWLPTENVVICGSTLINTDTGEKVHAHKIR